MKWDKQNLDYVLTNLEEKSEKVLELEKILIDIRYTSFYKKWVINNLIKKYFNKYYGDANDKRGYFRLL